MFGARSRGCPNILYLDTSDWRPRDSHVNYARFKVACVPSLSVGLGSKERPGKEREFGARAKIRKRGWGEEGRKRLQTNPRILKASVCLVIGWISQALLTCVDHRLREEGEACFSPNEHFVLSFDSTVEIL